eukprot:CAMPEP_0174250678 /NCGR_PEP_ID=MMETSP0439-20130205/778_1 /TAXON_ID=0 /ORGANISM="Stereomyxa ramosa, Strain Chinc5" /LENGTH=344 /DNA_ID=CAMNT_0015330811 /DNA_START=24 /DNA_END=1058 /DNA_ORIENTATION=+
MQQEKKKSLEERLSEGIVLCGEGYLFELEKRGYVQVGPYVPLVVLEHPDVVKQLHREFVRCGSDVVEAFTYYGHREKMKLVGMEDKLEDLNRSALRLAKEVAQETDALVAGNICNSTLWEHDTPSEVRDQVKAMFEEQVAWAADEGVDFIIGETFDFLDEALLATEVIKASGLPAVITLAFVFNQKTTCGVEVEEALKKLEDAGATVVGLNCALGPPTMLPLLKRARAAISCPLAALPVPFNTTPEKPNFQKLSNVKRPYMEMEKHLCNRFEMAEFARECKEIGVNYLGVCCGASPYHLRAMAEAVGHPAEAIKFSADPSKHFGFGNQQNFKSSHTSAWQAMND